ncbi:response regulator [Herbaspirillum seropedicae]|uniref:Receiver domain protein n=1 Tax=Herbaspirillum seropedicae (strain SmR1) TaxID=757424 RepID=D8J092_HERSS|nr:response regulator [Herbaspirillum seropedicae]ADJ62429.1 receiver domain protein [Herbaspirillum seropedicae SmR1]AKN64562.1 receiver domain-containing protein [Herbaspirillum seropedicae]NQE31018.1 receiver domain-containing protein [Herbaspirillum seropedicae]UMU20497.1 response regulator [Herbaspirillum seropedicae]
MPDNPRTRAILIIEDNLYVREIFAEVFDAAGYEVHQAGNGAEGLEILLSSPGRVSVVLTDLRMPVMDGLRFATELKKDVRFAGLPVVLLSATPMANSWEARKVFAALLVKPCPFSQLLDTVEAVQ